MQGFGLMCVSQPKTGQTLMSIKRVALLLIALSPGQPGTYTGHTRRRCLSPLENPVKSDGITDIQPVFGGAVSRFIVPVSGKPCPTLLQPSRLPRDWGVFKSRPAFDSRHRTEHTANANVRIGMFSDVAEGCSLPGCARGEFDSRICRG